MSSTLSIFTIISTIKPYSSLQIPHKVWCTIPLIRHLPVNSNIPQEASLTFILYSTVRYKVFCDLEYSEALLIFSGVQFQNTPYFLYGPVQMTLLNGQAHLAIPISFSVHMSPPMKIETFM